MVISLYREAGVPKLKINEHRYIEIDFIVDAQYSPAGSDLKLDSLDGLPGGPSSLEIKLSTGDIIHLSGEEADDVWQRFLEGTGPAFRSFS